MGKKKKRKAAEALAKREKRLSNLCRTGCSPEGCKDKCCEKFRKGEHKRCKKCPCFDLLKTLKNKGLPLQEVA